MSSITTAVAVDYRLQQWAQLVKDCQNRPQDMTVEQWCDTKGISKKNKTAKRRSKFSQGTRYLPLTSYGLNIEKFCNQESPISLTKSAKK